MPKITLPKSELKKFIDLTSFLNLSPDLFKLSPITEYIQLEIKNDFCTLAMVNSKAFVKNTFAVLGQPDVKFLVNSTILNKFISDNKKEEITITFTQSIPDELNPNISETTVFSNGISKLPFVNSVDAKLDLFPTYPTAKGLTFKRFDAKLVKIITESGKFVLPEKKDPLRPFLNHSLIGGLKLLASDSQISYIHDLDSEMESCYFNETEIGLIKNFEYFDLVKMDNWNIFKYKTIIYGSVLKEVTPFERIIDVINSYVEILDKSKSIKVDSDQLYDFCKQVKKYSVTATVIHSVMEVSDNSVIMTNDYLENGKPFEMKVDAVIIGYSIGYKIALNNENIQKALDGLESRYINISECVGKVDGGSNYSDQFFGFWLDSNPAFHSICSKGVLKSN